MYPATVARDCKSSPSFSTDPPMSVSTLRPPCGLSADALSRAMPASTALAAPLQILASPRNQGRSSSVCEILSTRRSRALRSSANTGHASMTRTAPDMIAVQLLDMLVTELPPMTGTGPVTDFRPSVIMGILTNQIRANCTYCGQQATYVEGNLR